MRNYYAYRLERETHDEKNELLSGLTDSLKHSLITVLAPQMRNYYAYRLERETHDEENELLSGLTDSLRSQLSLFVYKGECDLSVSHS